MAAYAAYRHIELDKVGAGKKRITNPPGGPASDIFSPEPEKQVVRKKSIQASSIVLNDESLTNGNTTPTAENGHLKSGTCNERLFGPPLDVINDLLLTNDTKMSNGTKTTNGSTAKINGEVITNGHDYTDAPKAAKPTMNGKAITNGINGELKNGVTNGINGTPIRNRVPPGGYSSGLW